MLKLKSWGIWKKCIRPTGISLRLKPSASISLECIPPSACKYFLIFITSWQDLQPTSPVGQEGCHDPSPKASPCFSLQLQSCQHGQPPVFAHALPPPFPPLPFPRSLPLSHVLLPNPFHPFHCFLYARIWSLQSPEQPHWLQQSAYSQ